MGPLESSARRRRRSSVASAADALLSSARHAESEVTSALLLLWDDLPAWRRDNAYILSGYRRSTASFADCFSSLGYLHNETVNIYSHLLGAAAFLSCAAFALSVVAPRYETASASDVLVFGCFFAGAVLCLGMSATYHAVLNHSEGVSRWGNKLDYSGIVFLIVGSYVPALYYGFFCEPELMTFYLGLVSALNPPLCFRLGAGTGERRGRQGRDLQFVADRPPWSRMRRCILGRSIPDASVETLPRLHVRGPRRVRRHPDSAGDPDMGLRSYGRAHGPQLCYPPGRHIHLRRLPLCGTFPHATGAHFRTLHAALGVSVCCSRIKLTLSRHAGRKGHCLASSTSGAARTSFSTSVWSSQR